MEKSRKNTAGGGVVLSAWGVEGTVRGTVWLQRGGVLGVMREAGAR